MLVDIIAPSLTQAKTVGEGHTMNLRHVLLELTDTIFLLLIMCVNVSFSKITKPISLCFMRTDLEKDGSGASGA